MYKRQAQIKSPLDHIRSVDHPTKINDRGVDSKRNGNVVERLFFVFFGVFGLIMYIINVMECVFCDVYAVSKRDRIFGGLYVIL